MTASLYFIEECLLIASAISFTYASMYDQLQRVLCRYFIFTVTVMRVYVLIRTQHISSQFRIDCRAPRGRCILTGCVKEKFNLNVGNLES